MKRIMISLVLLIAASAAFAATWTDGLYFAQEDNFASSGWKYNVTVEVKGGRIVSALWNGTNIGGGPDKLTVSKAGNYPMVARGGAKSDWHVQSALVQDYLLRTQDPKQIRYTDTEGHTDAISGVSIHVTEFFTLADRALAAGPVARGPYRDGYWQAEEAQFASSGWKYFGAFTVVNGTIVQVNWNGVHKDGGDTKKAVSAAGKYGMVANGGAKAEWHVQAATVERYFLANGGRAPAYRDGVHTDAIAGATVAVAPLFTLAQQAIPRR